MRKLFLYIFQIFLFSVPFVAVDAASKIKSPSDVIATIETVRDWMFSGLMALAIVFIIVAAYNFMFSGGSEEKVENAKKQLLYTLVAVAVAFVARGLISLVETLLSTKAS